MEILLVFTNLPDRAAALDLAAAMIERHLAACVNVLGAATSVYRWQGKVETATEFPVLMKTTAAAYPALERAIRELHPYELPEILAVPLRTGLSDFFQWVEAETQPDT